MLETQLNILKGTIAVFAYFRSCSWCSPVSTMGCDTGRKATVRRDVQESRLGSRWLCEWSRDQKYLPTERRATVCAGSHLVRNNDVVY